MTKKKSTLPKLRDIVVEAVKEGVSEDKLLYDTSPNWYRYFLYGSNPLASLNPETGFDVKDLEIFIDREAEIKIISNYFGNASKFPYNMHIAIMGGEGIGKHTTIKIICKFVQESFPKISFEYYNLKSGRDFKNDEDLSEAEIKKLDNLNLDVRIISCSGKNSWLFLKRLNKYKNNSKLLLSIWHTSEYPKSADLKLNKLIYFRNYTKSDVEKILKSRVETYLTISDEVKEYKISVLNDLVPIIAESFQGNLRISFKFFEHIHRLAKVQNLRVVPKNLIDDLMNKYLSVKNQKITSKEKEIVHYLLRQQNVAFITTSDLRDDLNFDRTVAWRYLENLTKKQVLTRVKYGNPSRYKIDEIFLSFYEDRLNKDIIFKES